MPENIKNTLSQITDPNIQGILTHLCLTITNRRLQIITLKNEITDKKSRISDLERYSSNDCLYFPNFPVNPLAKYVTHGHVQCQPEAFPLPNGSWPYENLPSSGKKTSKSIPFILKFMYVNDRNEIFERRKQLAGRLNNDTQMNVFERLRLEKMQRIGTGILFEICAAKDFFRKRKC